MVPMAGRQGVVVAFPGHVHLLFKDSFLFEQHTGRFSEFSCAMPNRYNGQYAK